MESMYHDEEETPRKFFGEIEEIEDAVQRRFDRFKNFDRIERPPSDHHFLINFHNIQNSLKSLTGSTLNRKIQRECDHLEENLPGSSIYVRVYETRSDIMRAAIVGPPGTSYQHGLFFFDILFPSNYPNSPPKLFYQAQEVDLNQNLRLDGRVYLPSFGSLQQDNKKEKWNPEKSSVLDVLRAIEKLCFRSKPKGNLARTCGPWPWGYSRVSENGTDKVAHESRTKEDKPELEEYNRMAFLKTCEKMLRDLHSPPLDFRDLVAGHFRTRSHVILLKFKEKMDDTDDMVFMFENLYRAFQRNGSYCGHYRSFLVPKLQKIAKKEREEAKRREEGMLSRAANKVKNNVNDYWN